jgi:hypothetical protein
VNQRCHAAATDPQTQAVSDVAYAPAGLHWCLLRWCVLELLLPWLRWFSCRAWERSMSDWASRLLNSLLPGCWLSSCRNIPVIRNKIDWCMDRHVVSGVSPFVELNPVDLIWRAIQSSHPFPWSSAEGYPSPSTRTQMWLSLCLVRFRRMFPEQHKYYLEPVTFWSGLRASAPAAQALQRAVDSPIGLSSFGPCHQASWKKRANSSVFTLFSSLS